MVGTRISDMPLKSALADGDLVPVVSGGSNYSYDLGAALGVAVTPQRYGAVGDMLRCDSVSMASGSAVLTGSGFTSADVGKAITVNSAGGGTYSAPLITTILSYQSPTHVTLAANASATVSGVAAHYGTPDEAAFRAIKEAGHSNITITADHYLSHTVDPGYAAFSNPFLGTDTGIVAALPDHCVIEFIGERKIFSSWPHVDHARAATGTALGTATFLWGKSLVLRGRCTFLSNWDKQNFTGGTLTGPLYAGFRSDANSNGYFFSRETQAQSLTIEGDIVFSELCGFSMGSSGCDRQRATLTTNYCGNGYNVSGPDAIINLTGFMFEGVETQAGASDSNGAKGAVHVRVIGRECSGNSFGGYNAANPIGSDPYVSKGYYCHFELTNNLIECGTFVSIAQNVDDVLLTGYCYGYAGLGLDITAPTTFTVVNAGSVAMPATNRFQFPAQPATQTVSLAAGSYKLHVLGAGSIALSGGPTGTATAGSPVSFTLVSTTSVTFTVSGTVTWAECNSSSGSLWGPPYTSNDDGPRNVTSFLDIDITQITPVFPVATRIGSSRGRVTIFGRCRGGSEGGAVSVLGGAGIWTAGVLSGPVIVVSASAVLAGRYVAAATGGSTTAMTQRFNGTFSVHPEATLIPLDASRLYDPVQPTALLDSTAWQPQRRSIFVRDAAQGAALVVESSRIDGTGSSSADVGLYERLADGKQQWGTGSAFDTNLYRSAADKLKTDDMLLTAIGIGVGNSAAATTPGTVVKKMQVFDASGTSLGYVPIYDAIT
jgi:hypothetical protein